MAAPPATGPAAASVGGTTARPLPAWRSIELRLPLLVSIVLIGILATFGSTAYFELKRALRATAGDRLAAVAALFADLLAQSSRAASAQIATMAAAGPIVAVARSSDDASRAAAANALAGRRDAIGELTGIEIRDAAGSCALSIAPGERDTGPITAPPACRFPPGPAPPGPVAGPLEIDGDAVSSRLATPIHDGDRLVGVLTEVRRLRLTPPGLVERLIGQDSRLLLGNREGGLWTDVTAAVPGPPIDSTSIEPGVYRDPGGVRRLGWAVSVAATPWIVWVELPEDLVLAPAVSLLDRILVLGTVIVLVGLAATILVLRRITEPLAAATRSAERIAAGDYTVRVPIDRRDELGRLGESFNLMAERVDDAHLALERRLEERSRELERRTQLERERNVLEAQLRQSQKMEAIGVLAGGIAHDFNNLLTVVIGHVDLLLRRVEPALESDLREIRAASERATALTRQLLAFSRKQVLEPKIVDLNAVISGIDPMLGRIIGEDIALVTVLDPALPAIKADPGQLEQIIVNLAANARDAMPVGGKLTVETRVVDLDEAYAHEHLSVVPGRYVQLSVSDTGVGMDRELQSRIFDPFFTTKETGRGTGLGLSTVYGIVSQSGGTVWVYSEPGKGATFKIYFPATGGVPSASPEPAPSHNGGTETILVVEDERAVRQLIVRILESLGYLVIEAKTPEQGVALSAAHPGPIDLLLTDVVMPRMSGTDVHAQVAAARPDIRVLFMSGYTDDAVVRHGVLRAEVAFLQKPFNSQSLATRIRQVLDLR